MQKGLAAQHAPTPSADSAGASCALDLQGDRTKHPADSQMEMPPDAVPLAVYHDGAWRRVSFTKGRRAERTPPLGSALHQGRECNAGSEKSTINMSRCAGCAYDPAHSPVDAMRTQ